jgi:epoxyqueuosine reductase QueG
MSVTLDEPLVAMAAMALTVAGGIIGAWWQRRHEAALPATRDSDHRLGLAIEARLDRLEGIAESTALEVERAAEAQRFTARLLAERAGIGASTRPPGQVPEHRTPH